MPGAMGCIKLPQQRFPLWCSSHDWHHYLSLQRFILFLCDPPGSHTSQLSELNGDVLGTTSLAHLKFNGSTNLCNFPRVKVLLLTYKWEPHVPEQPRPGVPLHPPPYYSPHWRHPKHAKACWCAVVQSWGNPKEGGWRWEPQQQETCKPGASFPYLGLEGPPSHHPWVHLPRFSCEWSCLAPDLVILFTGAWALQAQGSCNVICWHMLQQLPQPRDSPNLGTKAAQAPEMWNNLGSWSLRGME